MDDMADRSPDGHRDRPSEAPAAGPGPLSSVGFHGRDVLFAHWSVDPDRLAPVVPDALEVASHDGSAWLSALAHEVTVRAGGLALSGPFPQLNVRTYVAHDGDPGVYFLGLLTGSRPGGLVGERLFDLPIAHGAVGLDRRGRTLSFRSQGRAGDRALRFDARYERAEGASRPAPGSLSSFLVERNRYFAVGADGLAVGEIEREPWALAPTEATVRACALPVTGSLSPGAAVTHYSPGYEMRLTRLEPAGE
jgi:hypothetical protein